MRVCIVCQKEFDPQGTRATTCPDCKEEAVTIRRHHVLKTSQLIDEFSQQPYIKEEDRILARKNAPDKALIRETLSTLNDFGIIPREVPIFNSEVELERWKRQLIQKALS